MIVLVGFQVSHLLLNTNLLLRNQLCIDCHKLVMCIAIIRVVSNLIELGPIVSPQKSVLYLGHKEIGYLASISLGLTLLNDL